MAWLEVHHAVYTVAGEIIDDAVRHVPDTILPDSGRCVFHSGDFFILEFLDSDVSSCFVCGSYFLA